MVALSLLLLYLIDIPLGILLIVTGKDGTQPNDIINAALGITVNLMRSVPFIIMLLATSPFTRFIVRTTLDSKTAVMPLVLTAVPYTARMIESSLKEAGARMAEAAKSVGAGNLQIVWKVMLSKAKPSLLMDTATSVTTILGYSTMAGLTGDGGLSILATNYGYYRCRTDVILVTVVVLITIVQLIQESFLWMAWHADEHVR